MELKHTNFFCYLVYPGLLIVPYGIETEEIELTYAGEMLLIVPYGIETHLKR